MINEKKEINNNLNLGDFDTNAACKLKCKVIDKLIFIFVTCSLEELCVFVRVCLCVI